MKMQLFGSYTSPFVRHCRIAFLETGIAFDLIETDYDGSSAGSPAKRVPYLWDEANQVKLHDSMAIIQYLRAQANQPFLPTATDTDLFALANTVCDAAINIFLLEKSGVTVAENSYLQRQQARIDSGLQALNERVSLTDADKALDDAHWRVVCLLDWALYRERFSLAAYPRLTELLTLAGQLEAFQLTAPPR